MAGENVRSLLHLSHTNIECDGRILKEMDAVRGGFDRVVAVGVADDEGAADSLMKEGVEIIGLRLPVRQLFGNSVLRHTVTLLAFTWHAVSIGLRVRPQIVHCHDTPALIPGRLIKLVTGARLIYDAHELESNKNGQTAVLSKATYMIEKALMRSVDLLISVSPSIIQWYESHFQINRSVLVLNSPALPQGCIAQTKSDYFRRKYNIPESHIICLYLGYIGDGRGIPLILDAFSEDIGAHVVIMGYGSLKAAVLEAEKKSKYIHYHEAVPHEKVVEVANGADVGFCMVENVSLSDYYCLPNKLFEYLFAGLVVVASKFPDMEKIVLDHHVGVCCELTSDSIRQAVMSDALRGCVIDVSKLKYLAWPSQEIALKKEYEMLLK